MIDYLIYVRLIIGIGLLLAGGVSVFLDHSPSQIVLSVMALILGVLFVLMALFPKDTGVEEEVIHIDDIEVNDDTVKKLQEEYDKEEKTLDEKIKDELEK